MLDPETAFADVRKADGTRLDVLNGQLLLTCHPEALTVCPACPDLHVQVLPAASGLNLRTLALGLLHLADHLDDD
jgi:hypothetical protein